MRRPIRARSGSAPARTVCELDVRSGRPRPRQRGNDDTADVRYGNENKSRPHMPLLALSRADILASSAAGSKLLLDSRDHRVATWQVSIRDS